MKKLVSLLLAVCMCLSVGVMLTACDEEHEHTYKTEWSKDATHHWHECEGENCTDVSDKAEHSFTDGICVCGYEQVAAHTCVFKTEWSKDITHHWHECESEDCTEVSDKAEHTWNDGEITTPATAETDGVKTFTCTACGQTKTESVQLKTTVTKEEWENAFNNDLLTNYTIRYVRESGEESAIYKCTVVDGKHIIYAHIIADGTYEMEMYLVKTADKYIAYQKADGVWTETEMNANEISASLKDALDNWQLSYTMVCPNFSDFYDSFEYNDSEKTYVLEGVEDSNEIETNSILEKMRARYYYATVKMINGKIDHICVKMSGQDGSVDNIYFENYGTTTIELPTVTE